eukprot:scaffold282389_cov44-Tisochrysis_lutea.AAC.2
MQRYVLRAAPWASGPERARSWVLSPLAASVLACTSLLPRGRRQATRCQRLRRACPIALDWPTP